MDQKLLAETVMRAKQGDSLALEQLLRYAYPYAAYGCGKLLADPVTVERAVRQVLTVVREKLDYLESPQAFSGWVDRTCARICVSAMPARFLPVPEREEGWRTLPQQTPPAALDTQSAALQAEREMDNLPDSQRICAYLHYYFRLSPREVSRLLKASEASVCACLRLAAGQNANPASVAYLHHYLRRCAERSRNLAAEDAMLRSILEPAGVRPPQKEEPVPSDPFWDNWEPFQLPQAQPRRRKKKSGPSGCLVAVVVVLAILCAIALGLSAAIIKAGVTPEALLPW